jgi:hypothetical protein
MKPYERERMDKLVRYMTRPVIAGLILNRRILWTDLLKRAFGIDVLLCSRCKNLTSLVGVVRDPKTMQVTLTAMGFSPRPPKIAPAKRTGLWRDARELNDGIRIEATSGFVSDSDGTSTNHHTYIDGDFYQDP